jgi:hypothetical protein
LVVDGLLGKVKSEHALEILHGLCVIGIFQSQHIDLSLKLASLEINIASLSESLDENVVFRVNICFSQLEIVVIKFL